MGWREALRQTLQGFAEFYMVDFMDSVQNASLYHFLPPRSKPRIWGEEDLGSRDSDIRLPDFRSPSL